MFMAPLACTVVPQNEALQPSLSLARLFPHSVHVTEGPDRRRMTTLVPQKFVSSNVKPPIRLEALRFLLSDTRRVLSTHIQLYSSSRQTAIPQWHLHRQS